MDFFFSSLQNPEQVGRAFHGREMESHQSPLLDSSVVLRSEVVLAEGKASDLAGREMGKRWQVPSMDVSKAMVTF